MSKKKKAEKVPTESLSSRLNELENPIRQACNLAKALRMLASSDELDGEPGEAIFGVADNLVELIEGLQATRVELWRQCKAGKGGAS
jgi:hypothetical protein